MRTERLDRGRKTWGYGKINGGLKNNKSPNYKFGEEHYAGRFPGCASERVSQRISKQISKRVSKHANKRTGKLEGKLEGK